MNPTEPPKPAPTKAELEALHGDLSDFSAACILAAMRGVISRDEMDTAIAKYEREWSAAK